MTQLLVDPEFTRTLAADLQRAAEPHAAPATNLPSVPSLAAFSAAVRGAVGSVHARAEALRLDLGHVSRASTALADAAEATDEHFAHAFSREV